MTQYVFGTGQLFSTPVGGGAPLRFGALQDVNVNFTGDIKQLHGQYQFALDVARGKTSIEWSANTGNIDVAAFNTVFFGQTVATNDELLQAINEPASVPASTPYEITVGNAANFDMDLGVYYDETGEPLKQVQTAPAVGEYMVSTSGVYTFAAADTGKALLFNYLHESPTTGGSLVLTNQLMGNTPQFQLVLSQRYQGKTFTLKLYACVSDSLSMPLRQDDYMISELSGQAFADSANRVARITTTSISGG